MTYFKKYTIFSITSNHHTNPSPNESGDGMGFSWLDEDDKKPRQLKGGYSDSEIPKPEPTEPEKEEESE